ncbi:MAG TPA: VirB4 family type IV secretion/conjugal transfer ATPase, partial [Novosphingobium sp.]|nr:VirB4 family type IV secretion/conjugal transfer ATPase [Novosphingobium sp.]
HPSGLNPLLLPDNAANRRFLADWLACLAGAAQQPLSPAEARAIEEAVAANAAAPVNMRRLSCLVALLRGGQRPEEGDLYTRLRPWWGDGVHGWLFDHPPGPDGADGLDLACPTLGVDMTRLLDDPVLRTPAMMYLFHRVDERLDGRPAIIVVDEGWKALDDPVFAHHIRDWEKTIRKRGGILGFVTQNAGDALASRIAGAIVEQTATQIFTANPRARAEDYGDGFGLTAHECALVRSLPDNGHCFLVKQGGQSVVVRLNLAGEADLLAVLSGREASLRRFEAICGEVGPDPADWLPVLAGAGGAG